MNNILLYTLTVLAWGTTWLAIKLQVNVAPADISILYRAVLAGIGLFVLCKYKNLSLKFSFKNHIYFCGLGLSMFSLHYIFVYNAVDYIVSGVIAVVFACVSFLNIINNYIFFRTKPSWNVCLGALIGVGGLCIFFWDEIIQDATQEYTLIGLGLSLIGACIFSLGGSISRRNSEKGVELLPSMAIGMVYAIIALFLYTLFDTSEFILPDSGVFWLMLFYLALPVSIGAFVCYFKLIKNIGLEYAGYTIVMAPVVAMILSSVAEEYDWSWADFLGLIFVIIGNVLVMRKKPLKGRAVPEPFSS